MKILVAGIGGVGGYFGGMLAKKYAGSPDNEVLFLARGKHLECIQEHGLKVVYRDETFIAKPAVATDRAADLGVVDVVLICTKSYDLDSTMLQLMPCMDAQTVVIPLLNGVGSTDTIKAYLPGSMVTGGCAYIVSSIKEPGTVQNTGNIQSLYFGLEGGSHQTLEKVHALFAAAGIDATLSNNITAVMWEKFYLVAANSTATSYFDRTTGAILADTHQAAFMFSLLDEVQAVAAAKGIVFDKDMVAATRGKLASLPFETTSSLQRDFWKKDGKTEIETITGYIVRAGKALNVPTPAFDLAYSKLQAAVL